MGDKNPNAIRVAGFDERDAATRKGVQVSATVLEDSNHVSQFAVALDRPDEGLQPDPSQQMRSPVTACNQVELESTRGEQEGRPEIVDGYLAREDISIELH